MVKTGVPFGKQIGAGIAIAVVNNSYTRTCPELEPLVLYGAGVATVNPSSDKETGYPD